MANVADTLAQLESARQVVLTDSAHYAAVIPGVLPIIGASAPLEIRRWGADFLAESFASPVLPTQSKEAICTQVLPTLKELLETPNQDEAVVRSVIQVGASIYGLVFRHMYVNFLGIRRSCHAGA